MTDLLITVNETELEAAWVETNERTRDALVDLLPVEGDAARWGEELYMPVDMSVTPADTDTHVSVGSVAYWPDGPAICLFWGPTPASTDETPVAASPVAEVAQVADVTSLSDLTGGARLRIELA